MITFVVCDRQQGISLGIRFGQQISICVDVNGPLRSYHVACRHALCGIRHHHTICLDGIYHSIYIYTSDEIMDLPLMNVKRCMGTGITGSEVIPMLIEFPR